MVQSGWREENIVCVDFQSSPGPLVHGVQWVYGDLRQVLDPGQEEIDQWAIHQGSYNVVIAVNDWWPRRSRIPVVQFFWGDERGVLTHVWLSQGEKPLVIDGYGSEADYMRVVTQTRKKYP